MTIAAGFKFDKGALLCADTQHTYPGAMKLHASKIISRDLKNKGGGQFVFAIVGSVPYAHMAVDACIRAIKKKAPKDRTGVGIRLCLEEAIELFHQSHVYPHPAFHQAGGPDFQLLIAARSDADKTISLYATNDSAVTEVDDYDCLGTGSFLAHYLVPTIFRHKQMDMQDTVNIATHVLQETKDYVEACGGGSIFIALHDTGNISPISYWEISAKELFSRGFKAALQRLYVFAADLRTKPEALKQELREVERRIEILRTAQRKESDKNEELYKNLKRIYQDEFTKSIS